MLDFIGYTTSADDAALLRQRLPNWLDWLFSTPWWVPSILMAVLTIFVIWFCWPRRFVEQISSEQAESEGLISAQREINGNKHTYLKLLYRDRDATPELLSQSNVFRYYSLVNNLEVHCTDGQLKSAAMTFIFIVFENRITDANARVRFHTAQTPRYEIRDFGTRHAIIAIYGLPQNYSIEFETY